MKTLHRAAALGVLMAVCLAPDAGSSGPKPAKKTDDVLLSSMQRELLRAHDQLGKLDPPAYFMSYAVHDRTEAMVVGSQGSLLDSMHTRARTADVVIRVGSPALDNSHQQNRSSAISSGEIPLDDDPAAVAHVLWQMTYGEYRKASKAYLNVKTSTEVNAKEEDTSPDFSTESPQVHADYSELPPFPDQAVLEQIVRKSSELFRKYPYIYRSTVLVMAEDARRHFVSSEGSHEVVPSTLVRLVIQAETQADDGMELLRVETFQAETVGHLPGQAEIASRVEKIASDLKALRVAPLAEPYDGPALLSGRAAAVFFHEVLGHRLEGHRQRGEQEGQTFTKKVNTQILPEFLSVVDDPTRRTMNNTDLAGWYPYDDEGVPATAVNVITNGILKNFLMSRLPIKGFNVSNGHGRAQAGSMPTGRQGNLIVTSTRTVKDAELHQRLIDEIKKQSKPYGLYFEDIQGGFTLTQAAAPQVFQVLPVLVWRVYPDGRPDELVRGVDIVGTPLAAMSRILVTGDKTDIFNGICGAESGSVPVSAAAPAMLFSEIEVQKRQHSVNRRPHPAAPWFRPHRSCVPGEDRRRAMNRKLSKLTFAWMLALILLVSAQGDPRGPAPIPDDPVLKAMKSELERSKSQLKLEQMAAPYYIEYRIVDMDRRAAEAAFGALRSDLHFRLRFLRVVVRVGDYKQDSYFRRGEGTADFAPLDNDDLALRNQLWLATDRAYKTAISSLAAKQAQLKQLKVDQPVDDFARADPVQRLDPLTKLDGDPAPWRKTLEDATALYKTDPQIQSMTSSLDFRALNRYFVNSEGSIVRTGATSYEMSVDARTQASDGMELGQAATYVEKDLKDLPTPEKLQARVAELIGTLKDLRAAPVADEEYRGPVLFSSHAAATVFADLVGQNIRGLRPNLGQPARTLGPFASSYKSRVLPDFLSVVDDPTLASYSGKPLLGYYGVDDEGVKATRVLAVDKGNLVSYLLGRQPIRDFPNSNGHGRARSPTNSPEPSVSNLMVNASESASREDLKKKLIDLCRQRDQPYGYYVETVTGLRNPHLLYKVWTKDGHEELVRGAVFEDLDVRSLRNDLIAAGDDMHAWNRSQGMLYSIVNPSILFDELEVKRADRNKSTLPEYPPPPITPGE